MTDEELEDEYYVPAFFSSQDKRKEAYLHQDAPVRLAVVGCSYGTTGPDVTIYFDLDSSTQSAFLELAMTQAEALRLVEKIAKQVSWSLATNHE